MQLRHVTSLVSLFFMLSYSAYALDSEEKILCTAISDIDSDVGKIVYQMDQDNRAIQHLYQDTYHNGNRTNRIELKAVELRDGIVLNRRGKYDVIRIHSDNYDPERGGILYLDTLYSGISGERREYEMELAMDKSGPVLIADKQNFSKMNIVAKRSKLFGIIGIERIGFGN